MALEPKPPVQPRLAWVLAIDVGNTNVSIGAVRGDHVYVREKVPADDPDRLGEVAAKLWDAMEKPRRVVAASVNPAALATVERVIQERLEEPVAVVGRDLPPPIETALPEPDRIGKDRLCAAAAAYQRLQRACVVMDVGTAITIDCVDDNGVFLGGAILPGMRMQAAALHDRTAQLPQVELAAPDWVFGRNTNEAIVGGIVFGTRGAMRGIIEAYATELGSWPIVILTGGDAELVGLEEGIVQAIVPELSLIGVALALYRSLALAVQQESEAAGREEEE